MTAEQRRNSKAQREAEAQRNAQAQAQAELESSIVTAQRNAQTADVDSKAEAQAQAEAQAEAEATQAENMTELALANVDDTTKAKELTIIDKVSALVGNDGIEVTDVITKNGTGTHYKCKDGTEIIVSEDNKHFFTDLITAMKAQKSGTVAQAICLVRIEDKKLYKAQGIKTIGDFAEKFCSLKKATANIYVSTARMYYDITEDNVVLKDVRYENVQFAVLSQIKGFINSQCDGKISEFYTDFVDSGIINLHVSLAEVKAQLTELTGKGKEDSKPEDSKPEDSKPEDSKEDSKADDSIASAMDYLTKYIAQTANNDIKAILNTAINALEDLRSKAEDTADTEAQTQS